MPGFGVIGTGMVSRLHCQAIQTSTATQLVGICGTNLQKTQNLATDYGVESYTDLSSFLQMPELDAVCICVPNYKHAEIGIAAAQAGKHVLVEKPIEISLKAADALIEACRQAGVKLGVISQHRFAPEVQTAYQRFQNGELGKPILGQASIKWQRTQEYYAALLARGRWEEGGGGALINQAIHYIDLLQWFMGPVRQVKGVIATRTHSIAVEDTGVAVLEFSSGALGTIAGSTAIEPSTAEKLEIHGSLGSLVIETDRLVSFQTRNKTNLSEDASQQVSEVISSGSADPAGISYINHAAQIADFAAAIQENRAPAITGEDGRRTLELVLAIYQSAQASKP